MLCQEVEQCVGHEDPVNGVWSSLVPSEQKMWCDASSIAYSVVLQAGQVVIEDQGWLRRSDDQRHVNVAELGAVIKGLNLAIYWNVKELTVVTDSKTVFGWESLASLCSTGKIPREALKSKSMQQLQMLDWIQKSSAH